MIGQTIWPKATPLHDELQGLRTSRHAPSSCQKYPRRRHCRAHSPNHLHFI